MDWDEGQGRTRRVRKGCRQGRAGSACGTHGRDMLAKFCTTPAGSLNQLALGPLPDNMAVCIHANASKVVHAIALYCSDI